MPAFFIADVDVKDAEAYRAYREANPGIVKQYGGRYVALGGEALVLEGDWEPRRTIIIEFPSMEALSRFYDSPEYARIRPVRWGSAHSRIVAVETLDEPLG